MGHGASKQSLEKVAWSMPSWCLQDFTVTPNTIALANDSWRYCMGGESPPFLAAKAKEHSLTPLVFFYNQVSTEKVRRPPKPRKLRIL
jgi:hypothetical protein